MHSLINSYKNAISVALETDYSWEAIDELKDRIANPDAYATAAPAADATDTSAPAAAAEKEKEESEKEESEDEGRPNHISWKHQPSKANVHQVSAASSTNCDSIMILGFHVVLTHFVCCMWRQNCVDNVSYLRATRLFHILDSCDLGHRMWPQEFLHG